MTNYKTSSKSYITLKRLADIFSLYEIPEIQRTIDPKHVQKILDDQINEYNRFQSFSILQSITVAEVTQENVTYVIDGQHRIQVFKMLQDLNYDLSKVIIPVVVYKVMDKTELLRYFNMINSNMPVHPLELDESYKDYSKVLIQNMMKAFPIYLKNDSKNSRCPHINMNDFKKNLAGRELPNKLTPHNYTINDLWNKVMEFNHYVHTNVKSAHQLCPLMRKRIEDCETKATKAKLPSTSSSICFLGVWRRFEWLDFALDALVNKKSFDRMSLSCDNDPRQHIPITIRTQVWQKCNPNTSDLGTCFTCCNDVYFKDMECGHIKAHALGGDISVDNLVPICKSCNRDMGIMDLHEYKSMIEKMSRS